MRHAVLRLAILSWQLHMLAGAPDVQLRPDLQAGCSLTCLCLSRLDGMHMPMASEAVCAGAACKAASPQSSGHERTRSR